ncbi:hypothetical protein NC652_007272 [Populus alba x Populus x berolinensis]|uniref:Uncharacterized protein n=1 Tax=Populus alba x Populus x berolinensis TaxID=444605 RepID=A0AAD6WD79_9ROSI|nr:hypothetical protein NC652_007272 [Populus alba x Populus x berolinensis]KAJ7008465.1 hypothetical protein NC653_007207 [Populus alba x Populus x berolinensis]
MEHGKKRKISKIYRALVNGILNQDKVTPWLNHCLLLPFLFIAFVHSRLCCDFSSGCLQLRIYFDCVILLFTT